MVRPPAVFESNLMGKRREVFPGGALIIDDSFGSMVFRTFKEVSFKKGVSFLWSECRVSFGPLMSGR